MRNVIDLLDNSLGIPYYHYNSNSSSAAGGDYKRIQRQIQDFVAIYRRRVISPRSKAEGKGFIEGMTFRFHS